MNKKGLRSYYLSPRLLECLDEIVEYPLTIIEAPMGYGKTTAAREWLEKNDCSYLWKKASHIPVELFWKGRGFFRPSRS